VEVSLNVDERRALRWKARSATLVALAELGGEAKRSGVAARAREIGAFDARELEAALPERAAARYASPVDHALSWALTNLRRDGLVENPQRGVWRLTNVAAGSEERADGQPVKHSRLAELRAMLYADYLRTPEWRRTRAAALARAGHRCVLDASHTEHLEVHHNTYERVGAELASDLAVLCHSCHRLHHRTYGRPSRLATTPGSIAPPGYAEVPATAQESAAARGLSRLWRALAG
jgi:restriction endonuclease Mrr